MMKEIPVNNQIALVVTGIASPQLLLWRPLIQELISDELEVIYYTGSELSEEDRKVIQKIGKQSLVVEKFDEEKLTASTKWILYTDTADNLTHTPPLASHLNSACFFGGITSEHLDKQAQTALKLDINLLFSDLMASEIRDSLNRKCFEFFLERNFFLAPTITASSDQNDSPSEESLFIFNHHKQERLSQSSELYVRALQKINSFRIVELSKLPVEEWLTQCTPSKTCRKVIADISYRPINQFLVNICSSRKIEFQSLGTRGILMPERTLFGNSPNSTNWLDHVAPYREPSLREKTQSILITNPADTGEKHQSPDSYSNVSESSIISSALLNREEGRNYIFLEKIRQKHSVVQPKFKGHFISTPILHFFQGSYHNEILQSSLEFFLAQNDLPPSCNSFEKLLTAGLRLIAERKICRANFHILAKIKSFAPEHLLSSFTSIISDNPKAKKSINLASYIQHNLQYLKWNETILSLYYEKLLEMPLPSDILACLYLGANKFDSLDQLAQRSDAHSIKGLLGRAAYYKICSSPELQAEEAKILQDLCRKEISAGSENIYTHLSLATLGILFQCDQFPSEISIDSPKPSCDIKTHLTLRHELSLLSLAKEDSDSLMAFLTEGDQPFEGKTTYTTLSAIIIYLLLDEVEKAELLAERLLKRGIKQPWEENIHSIYHFALFHALIFRKTQRSISEIHATKIMDESLIPRDATFRNLLGKIEKTKCIKKEANLIILADLLESKLPCI